jgi:hypothetical protein
MFYFHLMEEGEEKKKEKRKKGERNSHGRRGFPKGWTCLANFVLSHSC